MFHSDQEIYWREKIKELKPDRNFKHCLKNYRYSARELKCLYNNMLEARRIKDERNANIPVQKKMHS